MGRDPITLDETQGGLGRAGVTPLIGHPLLRNAPSPGGIL